MFIVSATRMPSTFRWCGLVRDVIRARCPPIFKRARPVGDDMQSDVLPAADARAGPADRKRRGWPADSVAGMDSPAYRLPSGFAPVAENSTPAVRANPRAAPARSSAIAGYTGD